MRPIAKVSMILIASAVLAILLNSTIKSREDYMLSLPAYKHYRCQICHTSGLPTSGSDLNQFGLDFRNNGYKWDSVLASRDSDEDGFSNGIELGDEDGDGVAESFIERSNPGDPLNTPSSVNKETWGLIKSLFED